MPDINDNIDLPGNLADAERFQRLFVQPMVEAVKTEVRTSIYPLVQGHAELGRRVDALEGSQRKALVGYSVFAAGLSVALAAGWDWIKSIFYRSGT